MPAALACASAASNASFELDGVTHKLAANNGPHHLHGGIKGFDKRVWKAQPVSVGGVPAVRFTYTSADTEEGYPGTLTATVTTLIWSISRTNSAIDP